MLQALSTIPIILLKYLLFSLIIIAFIALKNIVYYILSSCLQSMLSNIYTCELGVADILYISILDSNMDRYYWISLALVTGSLL